MRINKTFPPHIKSLNYCEDCHENCIKNHWRQERKLYLRKNLSTRLFHNRVHFTFDSMIACVCPVESHKMQRVLTRNISEKQDSSEKVTKIIQHNCSLTRSQLDSEAATMYKLKGQSLNMRTGQGFKLRELVHPPGLSS